MKSFMISLFLTTAAVIMMPNVMADPWKDESGHGNRVYKQWGE
jgi:hypothetical protein